MNTLLERARAWWHARRWNERRTAEPEVERDPHQVSERPTAAGGDAEPGTTGTGPNDTFVGRVSGDDAGQ